jgi:hypothetical protein
MMGNLLLFQMFGSFVYWVNGLPILCMPWRSCGSFGWRRVHDDTPSLDLIRVVYDRGVASITLCLAVCFCLWEDMSLQFRCVLLYFISDGGSCAYGLLMIFILNMTDELHYAHGVIDYASNGFTPHERGIPHSQTPAQASPSIL